MTNEELREYEECGLAMTAQRKRIEELEAALAEIVGLSGSAGYLPPHQPTAAKAMNIARVAIDAARKP